MLLKPNTDVVEGTIVGPNGEALSKPTHLLTSEEAALLRRYKKFLQARGLREAIFCNSCFSGNLSDGTRFNVTDAQIQVNCRCRQLFYQGQSY